MDDKTFQIELIEFFRNKLHGIMYHCKQVRKASKENECLILCDKCREVQYEMWNKLEELEKNCKAE